MTTSADDDNPYAAPRVSGDAEDRAALNRGERIAFAGTVDQQQLRSALRSRISWSGLATFGIISLICFAASPSSLMLPWMPASIPVGSDLTGEIIGVVGLGFLLLSVWHIFATSTAWGLDRREKVLLEYSPFLYDVPTSGYLESDQIFLDQKNGEAWLAWDAVGLCQFGGDLVVIQWGNGVIGSTVLMREMFASRNDFDRAVRMFADQSDPARRKAESTSTRFESDDMAARIPNRDVCVATMKYTLDFPSAVHAMLIDIPTAMFRSSKPLHIFFGLVVGLSLLVTRQKIPVALVIASVWGGIMIVACVLSMLQNRKLLFGADKSSCSSTYTFLANEVHVSTASAYFVVPLDALLVDDVAAEHITVRQEGYSIANTFQQKDFDSDKDWLAVRALFESHVALAEN